MFEQAGKQAMKWGDMADQYKLDHKRLDAGFMMKLRKDISESRFEDLISEQPKTPDQPGAKPAAPPATSGQAPSPNSIMRQPPPSGTSGLDIMHPNTAP